MHIKESKENFHKVAIANIPHVGALVKESLHKNSRSI